MHRPLVLVVVALLSFALSAHPVIAQEATPASRACVAPALAPGTPTPPEEMANAEETSSTEVVALASPEASCAADAETSARILAGIESFVACRNAGDYATHAALLTPNRVRAEVGTANPYDVVAGLNAFNLPVTIVSLDNAQAHEDGRLSADFVHLFGPHLYYRSRLYVVEEDGYVKFDEERFLPEEPPGEQSVLDVRLSDFAFALDRDTIANAPYAVLHATNEGSYPARDRRRPAARGGDSRAGAGG